MTGFGGDSPLRGRGRESTACGTNSGAFRRGEAIARLRARCYPLGMELDLDESSLAIGRIERALSRIEKALADRANRPAPAIAAPAADQSALKAEVAAVIGELDRLIAEADRG